MGLIKIKWFLNSKFKSISINFAPNIAHSQQKRKYMKWWNKSEQTGYFFCCSTHDYIPKPSAFEQDGPSQSTQKHVLIVVFI